MIGKQLGLTDEIEADLAEAEQASTALQGRGFDLSELSLNQFSVLTGFTYRTIKARLKASRIKPTRQDNNAIYYNPTEVLPRLYQDPTAPERLDLTTERARLVAIQADKVTLEVAERRRELVTVAEAVELLQKLIVACRARILAIPTKAAPLVQGKVKLPEIREVLTQVTDEALHDLAAIDPSSLASTTTGDADGGKEETSCP